MATGRKYPHTRGHPTRWARIQASTCVRGHRRGHRTVPNKQRYTGKKRVCPHPQIRQTRTDMWGHCRRSIYPLASRVSSSQIPNPHSTPPAPSPTLTRGRRPHLPHIAVAAPRVGIAPALLAFPTTTSATPPLAACLPTPSSG